MRILLFSIFVVLNSFAQDCMLLENPDCLSEKCVHVSVRKESFDRCFDVSLCTLFTWSEKKKKCIYLDTSIKEVAVACASVHEKYKYDDKLFLDQE